MMKPGERTKQSLVRTTESAFDYDRAAPRRTPVMNPNEGGSARRYQGGQEWPSNEGVSAMKVLARQGG